VNKRLKFIISIYKTLFISFQEGKNLFWLPITNTKAHKTDSTSVLFLSAGARQRKDTIVYAFDFLWFCDFQLDFAAVKSLFHFVFLWLRPLTVRDEGPWYWKGILFCVCESRGWLPETNVYLCVEKRLLEHGSCVCLRALHKARIQNQTSAKIG